MIRNVVGQLKTQYTRWGLKLAVKNLIYHLLYRERRKTYGKENPDKTFYVIRGVKSDSRFYIGVNLNLLANFSYVISHLLYAQEKGWIPIVDQLHYPVYNKEAFPINGSDNPWEYFWNQPSPYTLDEVYRSRNVVLSSRSWYAKGNPEYSVEAHQDPRQIEWFHEIVSTVPLNESMEKLKAETRDILFPKGSKILGVSMRNAGHAKNSRYKAPGHPIQPECEELIQITRERMQDWGADHVFLTTEENENVNKFRMAFGDKLIVLERERYDGWRFFTPEDPNPLYLPGKRYNTTKNYLLEMELLSECDCLIGSITSGLRYAVFRNGGRYQNLEILDRGRFDDPRRHDLT